MGENWVRDGWETNLCVRKIYSEKSKKSKKSEKREKRD
jgi:hypothetical protein